MSLLNYNRAYPTLFYFCFQLLLLQQEKLKTYTFLAPLGAQGVLMSVRLSVDTDVYLKYFKLLKLPLQILSYLILRFGYEGPTSLAADSCQLWLQSWPLLEILRKSFCSWFRLILNLIFWPNESMFSSSLWFNHHSMSSCFLSLRNLRNCWTWPSFALGFKVHNWTLILDLETIFP